jgi:hypothetical protein
VSGVDEEARRDTAVGKSDSDLGVKFSNAVGVGQIAVIRNAVINIEGDAVAETDPVARLESLVTADRICQKVDP